MHEADMKRLLIFLSRIRSKLFSHVNNLSFSYFDKQVFGFWHN